MYLEVSLGFRQAVVCVGTFNSVDRLAGDIFAMASVLLSQAKEGLNGLLVCKGC